MHVRMNRKFVVETVPVAYLIFRKEAFHFSPLRLSERGLQGFRTNNWKYIDNCR